MIMIYNQIDIDKLFFRENVVKTFISNSSALTPVFGAMKKFKLFYQSKTACLKFMEIQQIKKEKLLLRCKIRD